MIDWSDDNAAWGARETCVHFAANGSWVNDKHTDDALADTEASGS
jgi:hypothetical protein